MILERQEKFDEIDLHGFFKDEAIEILNERVVSEKLRNVLPHLVVITGKLHSVGLPVLKPAVIKYAAENNIMWSPVCDNLGRIKLHLKDPDTDVEAPDLGASVIQHGDENKTRWPPAISNLGRDNYYLGEDTDVEPSISNQMKVALSWCASISVVILMLVFLIGMLFFLGKFARMY